MFLQSLEVGNLRDLDRMTDLRIAQLIDCSGRPWDFTASGDPRTYPPGPTPPKRRGWWRDGSHQPRNFVSCT